jgi:hypothetical protein
MSWTETTWLGTGTYDGDGKLSSLMSYNSTVYNKELEFCSKRKGKIINILSFLQARLKSWGE